MRSEQICFWLEFGTDVWVTSGNIAVLSRLVFFNQINFGVKLPSHVVEKDS